MADEEEVKEIAREVAAPTRVERLTSVLKHDCPKAFAEEVLEMTQVILDGMAEGFAYKDVAASLKKNLDTAHKGTWHVIVGPNFGCNVTNDSETLVNLKINEMYVLVFRSGPPERPVLHEGDA